MAVIENGRAPVVATITHLTNSIFTTLLAVINHKWPRVHQSGKCHSRQGGKDISDKEGSASPASQKTDDQRAGEEEDNKKKERAADGRTSAASSGSTAKPASSAQIDETADDGTTHRQEAPDAEDVDEGSSNGTAYDETDTVPGTDGSDQLAADTSQGMNPGMFILVLLGGAAVIGGIPVLWFFLIGKRNKDEEEEQQ